MKSNFGSIIQICLLLEWRKVYKNNFFYVHTDKHCRWTLSMNHVIRCSVHTQNYSSIPLEITYFILWFVFLMSILKKTISDINLKEKELFSRNHVVYLLFLTCWRWFLTTFYFQNLLVFLSFLYRRLRFSQKIVCKIVNFTLPTPIV